jgi:serine/threonine-protein kinase
MDAGTEFSHYRIIEHIGRGGMADVWSARDIRLARTVAVKTIAGDLSAEMNPVKLFEREAQTIAALEHPHILPIYEFGEYDAQLYIVMRYVSGGSLEDVIEKGPLSVSEMLRIVRAVGQALDYAHASKVIHLDLKPSNILLDSYQSPYLADFGLATMLDPEGRAKNPGSGTLLYMAPEQLTADLLDGRADIYSFAVMIFHMLTGQLPFDAAVPLAIRQLQSGEGLPDIAEVREGLPPHLNVVLREATMLNVDDRTQSMRELLFMLEQVLSHSGRAVGRVDALPTPGGTAAETRGVEPLSTAALASAPLDDLISRPITPPGSLETRDLEGLITGPVEDLISRPINAASGVIPDEILSGPVDKLVTRTETSPQQKVEDWITGPIDDLIRRPAAAAASASETRNLDDLITGPIDNLVRRTGSLGSVSAAAISEEEKARQEAIEIYQRARRAYQSGQGRFVLGVTDFTLIADYYQEAERHTLELDDAGLQMFLRGAIEYDYELEFWWAKLNDDARRWTCLHALRSQNAPTRTRALELLIPVADADPPQIPRLVAQALKAEGSSHAALAAIHLLEVKAVPAEDPSPWWETLGLWTHSPWRSVAHSRDIDLLLAERALSPGEPDIAMAAARTIGRLRSETGVLQLVKARSAGQAGATQALALARDESNSLPPSVGFSNRIIAWLNNTWRRISENGGRTVGRFVSAAAISGVTMAVYVFAALTVTGTAFFNMQPETYGRALSTGLTFGLMFAVTVLIGDGIPQRLRGFWTWWARLLWAGGLGALLGMLTWGAYFVLILYNTQVDWGIMASGGLGIALAFMIMNALRLPGVLNWLITAICLYVPIYLAWDGYWNIGTDAIIYFREYEQVFSWGIPMIAAIALGVTFQSVLNDVRWLLRRLPGKKQNATTTRPR